MISAKPIPSIHGGTVFTTSSRFLNLANRRLALPAGEIESNLEVILTSSYLYRPRPAKMTQPDQRWT